MRSGDASARTLALYDILLQKSDESHLIPMPVLQNLLEEKGYPADRRAIYRSIDALNQTGHPVCYRKGGGQGYYAVHSFTPAEAAVLNDAVAQAASLSDSAAKTLQKKILQEISQYQQKQLPAGSDSAVCRTDNSQVLETMELLNQAITGLHPVEFRYYDLTLSRQKQYRKQNRNYRMVPYALISDSGRYYCVFYSEKHQGFANFRLDKMDQVHMSEETADPHPFDRNSWIQSSFRMYSGKPQTVTAVFDRSLTSIVFDQFGRNILISAITDTDFTASIRTALTPTLTSWFLTFYDRIQILKPQQLIDDMLKIAETLNHVYRRDL